MPFSFNRKIWVLVLLPLIFGGSIKAQLPIPEDFCSHAKSGKHAKRSPQIDYSNHDIYDVHFYHLNISTETTNTDIDGNTIIKAKSISEIDSIYLELSHLLEITKVLVNQNNAKFSHSSNDIIEIICPTKIPQETIFEVEIFYNGTAGSENGRGFNSANSYHETRVNWTLSEPFYSKD